MPTVGRHPTKHLNLPNRMHAITNSRGVTYYYYDTGGKPRYLSLGKEYLPAVEKWTELERKGHKPIVITLSHVKEQYWLKVVPEKKPRTQIDNAAEAKKLIEFFGEDAPFEAIRPVHVKQYREWRSKTAKIRANRELALLSHMWNMAREWGVTDLPNPCEGVKRNRETGRDAYLTDDQVMAVAKHGHRALQLAIELAYLTGQRPADVLKMRETDIRDGCIEIKQGKGDKKLRIEVIGRLAEVIEECRFNKKCKTIYSTALIVGVHGKPISRQWLGVMWKKAKTLAGVKDDIQFRDLRAKAVSDKEENTGNIRDAQQLAGHSTVGMTEHYSRKRRGAKITPTK